MTFSAGTRLGPYQVGKLLGAGGMGEVYRATDTKLRRDVALKVLPEEFSRDNERMARLEHEAHLLASLNHPNIAAIYGLEESNGVRALAMELVDGPTLGERPARSQSTKRCRLPDRSPKRSNMPTTKESSTATSSRPT